MPKHLMTQQDASGIQSSQAKNGRDMSSGGFASKAQSAGAKNANADAGKNSGSQENPGGGNAGGKK